MVKYERGDYMRTNLHVFRIKRHMTQEQISQKIGCTRATYSSIESGKRNGRQDFWKSLQSAFEISDGDMWLLMQKEG